MGNKKATGFLCLRLVPCFAYVGAEDNRKGIPFVKIVSLLCKLIQFLMVALSVTVHKALILLVFLNHPYQSLAFIGFTSLRKSIAVANGSYFIIVLIYSFFPGNALICKGFRGYGNRLKNYSLWQASAELNKLLLPVRSNIDSKRG